MMAGILLVAPFLVTFWILSWLYLLLEDYFIAPTAKMVVRLVEGQTASELPVWFANYLAPLLGVLAVAVLLYFLGFFAQSRVVSLVNRFLLRVPIVTAIHRAVSRAFEALKGGGDLTRFRRAVLVAFPHPGMRVPGFVTASCRDEATGKTILCVYVPTTPIPTSGYMLLIPEEEVTELNWSLEDTVQTVVSFGITAPQQVRYHRRPTQTEDIVTSALNRTL
jgi:uncharacterized membrane protein